MVPDPPSTLLRIELTYERLSHPSALIIAMTVQIYKPTSRRARPTRPLPTQLVSRPTQVKAPMIDLPPVRNIRHVYKPMQPRLDLILAIEALTHPDQPTFAELAALIGPIS